MIDPRYTAFFQSPDGELFYGNDPARGPWDANGCHAGPVTALIARAVEQRLPVKQLVRLSVELHRPVPMDGFRITAQETKQGRGVSMASAEIHDCNGKRVAVAQSLHIVVRNLGPVPTHHAPTPDFDNAQVGEFAVAKPRHGLPSFRDGVEVRYPPGEKNSIGPTTFWMKTLPILEGEEPSPFQRLCPLADCPNGSSRNLELDQMGFVNPDITIVMFRPPTSEWLALSSRSFWESTGIGLAEGSLFDREGPVAEVMQTLFLQPAE